VAETAPPSDSPVDRIQRWLEQDGAASQDVSRETSPEPKDEPELAAAEADESDDYQPQPNAQTEGDEATEPESIRSLSDLAKRLEIGEEDLAKHLVVAGRGGEEVSLHDVLTAYRVPPPDQVQAERAQARLAELEGREADLSRAAEELRQSAQALAKHIRGNERTPQDWAKLQAENPSAYLNARLEHMEQVRQLEVADRQYQAARHQEYAAQQQKVETFRREQAQKLRAAVPEWSDPKVMESDLGKVEKHLLSRGITAEELSGLSDHRDWLIARDAMLYRELLAQKPDLLKKVKALPKVIAPGASSGADRGTAARQSKLDEQLMARVRESGDKHAAAALITNRIAAFEKRSAARTLASGRRS
jgi:hypothetical protein